MKFYVQFGCFLKKKGVYAAGLAAVSLLGIVVFNLGSMNLIFRDVGLLLAALALVTIHKV
jgi:hypothetical protein